MGNTVNRTKAIEVAQKLTGVTGEDNVFEGNGWTIEYRARFNDWVTWRPGQLEGTLRGDDEEFVKWGEKSSNS